MPRVCTSATLRNLLATLPCTWRPTVPENINPSIHQSLAPSLSVSLAINQPNKQANQSINQSINKSNKQTSKQANKQANKQTSKQTSKQTNKQANKQDDKQANRQLTIQSHTTFTDVHLSDQPANDGQLISNGFPWISEWHAANDEDGGSQRYTSSTPFSLKDRSQMDSTTLSEQNKFLHPTNSHSQNQLGDKSQNGKLWSFKP